MRSTARASWWRAPSARRPAARRRSASPPRRRRRPTRHAIVFIHGTSRADKLWPEASWIELGRRLVAAGQRIALPRADAEEEARARRIAAALGEAAEVWPAMDLGAFIDRLAATGGAIGVDSGPSHIAVALDLPHVQIYNHPTAWRTGPQARHGHRHQVSIEGRPTPDGRRGLGRLAAGASGPPRRRRERAGRAMSVARPARGPRRVLAAAADRPAALPAARAAGGAAPSRSTPPRSASASAATAAPCRRARSGSMRSRSARPAPRRR